MTSLAEIVKSVAVSIEDGNTVVIELICGDEYAAVLLYEDVLSRMASERGMMLRLKAGAVVEGEGAA